MNLLIFLAQAYQFIAGKTTHGDKSVLTEAENTHYSLRLSILHFAF